MDFDIKVLEATLENVLAQSDLPSEVKRLVLVELAGKMAEQANIAATLQNKAKEVSKDAESV